MRAIFAAILTTAFPMIVGQRFIRGLPIIQWSLGAVLGIALLALGGLFGGLAGSPVLGAVLMLLAGWFVAPRLRWDAGRNALSAGVWRVVIVLLGVGAALMIMSLFRPVASWDGWFTWSVKSKGLALTGSFHSPVFLSPAYNYSSQSYPTLLPSWQALAYIISGDLTISWPLQFQQAWLWTAGAVALIGLADQYARGMFLLPLVWVVTPEVVWQSMQGYADVPMALMLVLGAVVSWKGLQDPRAQVVAGVLLAAAALTKSEGTPLVGIVLLSLLFTRKPTAVSGIAPAMVFIAALPWFIFAKMHGLRGDLVDVSTVTSWIRGEAPDHLSQVVSIMAQEVLSPFRWGVLVPACLLAALLARRIELRVGLAALLQLALFAAVYHASGSFQSGTLEEFMHHNAHRILITPLGILALSVALGASEPAAPLEPVVRGNSAGPAAPPTLSSKRL
jgi:hypothetical protein